MNKKILPIVITVIVIGSGSFFFGMKYGQNNNVSGSTANAFRQFGGGAGRNGMRGGLVAGQIISQDANSITVKMRDGGSKIIFLSDATQVMKVVAGTTKDLAIGDQITTTGTTNTDDSVTAQSVQIRPNVPIIPTATSGN